MEQNEIKITEIFKSLSGEGNPVGAPTTYIRFFGCNMNPICTWCDTMYSVKEIDDSVQTVTLEEIVNTIVTLGAPHVCFTGGEPMLYLSKIKTIMELCALQGDYTYHFETNGMICPDRETWLNDYDVHYAVSPKLHALDLKDGMHLKNDCGPYIGKLRKWCTMMKPKFYMKFVFEGPDTIADINRLKRMMMGGLADVTIYLMPEGRTLDKKKWQEAAKYCIENNWHFSPRLQVVIWDDKRGT